MSKPPKTPPDCEKPAEKEPKSDELKREEDQPGKAVREVEEEEKGMPPDSATPWN